LSQLHWCFYWCIVSAISKGIREDKKERYSIPRHMDHGPCARIVVRRNTQEVIAPASILYSALCIGDCQILSTLWDDKVVEKPVIASW